MNDRQPSQPEDRPAPRATGQVSDTDRAALMSTPSGKAAASLQSVPSDAPNARMVGRQDLTSDAALFQIAPVGWDLPPFEPGQFAMLGLLKDGDEAASPAAEPAKPLPLNKRLLRRAYSIASAPSSRGFLEFYIVRVDDGRFTPRLWSLAPGDALWLDQKIQGQFTIDNVPASADLIMVATGTGVAPYMSMLRAFQKHGRWRRAALMHGVRFVTDLGYHDELEQRTKDDPDFVYVPTVTREPAESSWPGQRGRVQTLLNDPAKLEALTNIPLDPATCHVMLCGNPDMVKEVQALLEGGGFTTHHRRQPGNIHCERYW